MKYLKYFLSFLFFFQVVIVKCCCSADLPRDMKFKYAISITKNGGKSSKFEKKDIDKIFSILRELFYGRNDEIQIFFKTEEEREIHNTNKEKAREAYNANRVLFDKIRINLHIIVSNEYFFGKGFAYDTGLLEGYIGESTRDFINTVFYVNFLRLGEKQISIYEIDRYIAKLSSSLFFGQMIENMPISSQIPDQVGVLKDIFIPGHNTLVRKMKDLSQLFDSNSISLLATSSSLQDCIGSLNLVMKNSIHENIEYPVLENISISFFRGQQLTLYRKSTYYNELKSGKLTDDRFPLFLFGNGVDLVSSPVGNEFYGLAVDLQKKISTQICRDLMCEVRAKDKQKRFLHIIQSNTIKLNGHEKNLPPCDYFLHVDAFSGGQLYKPSTDGTGKVLIEQKKVFGYEFSIAAEADPDIYILKIFELPE